MKISFPDKLNSEVYGPENPPQDWADVSFLIPHEGLRRQLDALLASVDRLAVLASSSTTPNKWEAWRAVYFCEWFVDCFVPGVKGHHDNEEEIYFPWVATRCELPSKLSVGHEELVDQMIQLSQLCEKVLKHEGKLTPECKTILKEQLPPKVKTFAAFFREHLAEEERNIPPLLRAHFTNEEENATIQKIIQREGLAGMRNFFPTIALAMQQWATASFYDEFMASLPGPVRHLTFAYYIPDERSSVIPKRDAPLLEKQPTLTRVSCCRIPGCFPCLV